MYKLDGTAFKAGNHASASNNYEFWKDKSPEEKLRAAFYLNSVAFNFSLDNPPRLDRTAFSMRKHEI